MTNNRWDIRDLPSQNNSAGLAQCLQLPAGQQAWVSRDFVWSRGIPVDLGTAVIASVHSPRSKATSQVGVQASGVYQLGSEWILTGGASNRASRLAPDHETASVMRPIRWQRGATG